MYSPFVWYSKYPKIIISHTYISCKKKFRYKNGIYQSILRFFAGEPREIIFGM